jgi:hypothetical protein
MDRPKAVNTVHHAAVVLRSLRSKVESNNRYQTGSLGADGLNSKQLNEIVATTNKEIRDETNIKSQLKSKVDNWMNSAENSLAESECGKSTIGTQAGKQTVKIVDSDDDEDYQEYINQNQQLKDSQQSMNDDDDFLMDDPDDMEELLKGFTAPVQADGKVVKKNPTNTISKSNILNNTNNNNTINGLMTSKGVVIKPGQAIRVRPKGSRLKKEG